MGLLSTIGAASGRAFGFTRSAIAAATDAFFNRVTLLLPGNGTNGAQNNTFLDSSTNNFSITRNGNTTQGTFSPFSQTGWSNYFGGDGNYITAPYNAAFDYGTGDFSVECFAYIADAGRGADSSKYGTLISGGLTSSNTNLWNLYFLITSGVISSIAFDNGGATILTASSQSISINAWHHFVLCRTGTTLSIFVDGNRIATTTYSSAVNTNSSGNVQISRSAFGSIYQNWASGYFSNVRIVKGTQPYNAASSTITQPTAALTAITNTSLLTCQDNRFRDASSNAFAITVNGTPSIQAFSPFAPTAAYSAATNGGSGYFDGTGDELSIAANAAFQFGTGDFTIEGWIYTDSSTETYGKRIVSKFAQAGNGGWLLEVLRTSGNTVRFMWYNATPSLVVDFGTNDALAANAWHHIAVSRSGANVSLFVDGVRKATSASVSGATDNFSATVYVGGGGAVDTYTDGYLSNIRLVKGTAVYDPTLTTLTVPTAPLTAITNTSLLLNYTNAGITDATAKNVLETVGNAQISTTQSKFGGSSLYSDGTGDRLVGPNSPVLNIQGGNWTIEAWVYAESTSGYRTIVTKRGGANFEWGIGVYNGSLYFFNGTLYTGGAVSTNTWTHVAAVRNGTTTTLYVNGVGTSIGNIDSGNPSTGNLIVFAEPGGTECWQGYIDDIRITRGFARYTTTFTPPTQAFTLQ